MIVSEVVMVEREPYSKIGRTHCFFLNNFFIIILQNANYNNNSVNANYNSIFSSPVISGYLETFLEATL